MDRDGFLKMWDEAWKSGLWHAAWSRVLEGLTPAQVAWRPHAGRHCIWEILNHMTFWREHEVRLLAGAKPKKSERKRRNFEAAPENPTPAAWKALKKRFAETHRQIRKAAANPKTPLERITYLLPHDCYHVGQIMYLRSMQGLPPIE